MTEIKTIGFSFEMNDDNTVRFATNVNNPIERTSLACEALVFVLTLEESETKQDKQTILDRCINHIKLFADEIDPFSIHKVEKNNELEEIKDEIINTFCEI